MQQAASSSAPPAGFREEVTDDGWVLLGTGSSSDTAAVARPPRPPRRGGNRPPAGAQPPFDFDPAPDDLVGRYLPARRALRCGDLPPQIHDADVYAAAPDRLRPILAVNRDDTGACGSFFFQESLPPLVKKGPYFYSYF